MKKLIISTVAALCLGVVSIPASASQSDIQAVQSNKLIANQDSAQQLARVYYRNYYTPGYGCGYRGCGFRSSCGFNSCGSRCYNPCRTVCYDRVVYRGNWRHHHVTRHHMIRHHHRFLHHRR